MDDGGERIRWARELRLPLALTALQLAVWPLGPLAFGATVDPVRAWQLTAVTVVVAAALSVRTAAPVAGWAVTLAAVSCLEPLGLVDEALVVPFGDLFALYAVAARRTLRVSVVCAVSATVVSTLAADVLTRPDPLSASAGVGVQLMTTAADAVLSAVAYAAVVVFGRSRRRRTARREAVRVHVSHAAEHERAAAARERERLSQELHDVSAHHLTAVVVQLAAAQRLRDPALTTQALEVARTSGRAASRSLHHLVTLAGRDGPAAPPAPPGATDLTDLVAGFTRLGLHITVHLDPAPAPAQKAAAGDPDHAVRRSADDGLVRGVGRGPGGGSDGRAVGVEVAEALVQIAQEALTNVLRYAPGAAVTVSVVRDGDVVILAVDDDGAAGGGGFDLGSGSGIPGMRARAARLGGTVTAGPLPSGGWSVRAVLPAVAVGHRPGSAPAPQEESQEESRGESQGESPAWRGGPAGRVLDGLLIVVTAGLPVFIGAAARAEERAGPLFAGGADAAMTVLFLIGHCAPLWWRRRAPVAALSVMLGVALAGGIVSRVVPAVTGFGTVAPLALGGIVGGVYAVGRYATRRPALTWLAAVGAAAVAAVALVVRFVDPADFRDGTPPQLWAEGIVFVTVVAGAGLSLLTVPWWLTGLLVARHHARADRRDRVALRDVADRAVRAARQERARIADGLRDQVLRHTSALLDSAGHADGGTPDATGVAAPLGHARAALTAMRELLTVLRIGTATAPRAAQPTLAGLADLCGPGATLDVRGGGREVPLEVELCAFRLVEAVLPTGAVPGGGPVLVLVEQGPTTLRVRVDRLAGPVPRPVLAALRERVDAVGGSLTAARPTSTGWQVDATIPVTDLTPSPRSAPPPGPAPVPEDAPLSAPARVGGGAPVGGAALVGERTAPTEDRGL